MPITFALILLYLNVYNKYSPATIFNFTIIIFIIVFSIFGFWLIPNYEYYRLSDIVINKLIKNYIYLKWILVILQNWVVVMFYVIGELWTPFSYSLLLWELINRITTIKDSKIHYPIFNFFGQLSTSICGLVIFLAFNYLSKIHVESEIFSPRLVRFLIGLVVASTLLILAFHYYLNKGALVEANLIPSMGVVPRYSYIENIKFICKSKLITLMSANMIFYGICIMLIEGIWFARVRQSCPTLDDFLALQSQVMFLIGLISLFFSFVCGYLLSKFGWCFVALITPLNFAIFGNIFLMASLIEKNSLMPTFSLPIIVQLGSLAIIFGKSAKYVFFDTSKEMCYISMDLAARAKSKVVIDLFSFQIGKLFGSSIPFIIFTFCPSCSYNHAQIYIFIIFAISSILWLHVIIQLDKILKSAKP